MKHKYTKDEQKFIDTLKAKYPEHMIQVEFTDGRVGLEDMSFPYWKITVVERRVKVRSKTFYDQIGYGRSFGDAGFHNCDAHYQAAFDFIEGGK